MPILLQYHPTGKIIEPYHNGISEFSVVETPVQTDPTESSSTLYDVNYTLYESAGSLNEAKIVPDALPNEVTTFTAKNEDNATIDQEGQIGYVSNGEAIFHVRIGDKAATRHVRTMTNVGDADSYEPTSLVAGSLGKHVSDNIATLTSGKSAGASTQTYIEENTGTWDSPVLTFNSNSFVSGYDFSGVAVSQTGWADDRYAPTLVTDRHALVARHVAPSVGEEVVFRRANGTYQKVTVDARYDVLNGAINLDLSILYFDADITGCSIFKTLPQGGLVDYCRGADLTEWGGNYFPTAIPVLRKAMHLPDGSWESAFQISMMTYISGSHVSDNIILDTYPIYQTYSNWVSSVVGGDSGSPTFFLVDDGQGGGVEPILICSKFYAHNGVDISQYVDQINTNMKSMADAGDPDKNSYALTHPVMTNFTDYSI